MHAYSDPSREGQPNALPDLEVFEWPDAVQIEDGHDANIFESVDDPDAMEMIRRGLCSGDCVELEPRGGWYYWVCFPGCLPDSDAEGPFDTCEAALEDARDNYGE